MSIRLRLAVAFGLAAAALFALGGWLFASGLSSAQLKTLDSQQTAQLAQAGRYLPAGSTGSGGFGHLITMERGRAARRTAPLSKRAQYQPLLSEWFPAPQGVS